MFEFRLLSGLLSFTMSGVIAALGMVRREYTFSDIFHAPTSRKDREIVGGFIRILNLQCSLS